MYGLEEESKVNVLGRLITGGKDVRVGLSIVYLESREHMWLEKRTLAG